MNAPPPTERPPWWEPAAIGPAPTAGYGVASASKGLSPLPDLHAIVDAVARDEGREIGLAWSPASRELETVYDLPEASAAVLARDREAFERKLPVAKRATWVFAGLLVMTVALALLEPTIFRLAGILLLLLLFGRYYAGPAVLWDARRHLRRMRGDPDDYRRRRSAGIRFGLWAGARPHRVTKLFVLVLVAAFILQMVGGLRESVDRLGLVKPEVRNGEWWRLVTAGFLHAHFLHIFFNGMVAYVLGLFVESLVGGRALLLVFTLSVVGGSLLSMALMPETTSVGASGGILGFGGFLLVASRRRPELREVELAEDQASWLLAVAVVGLLFYRFIDNGAHLGGALTGAALAFVLIPAGKRRTTWPPRSTPIRQAALSIGLLAFLAAAAATLLVLGREIG